MEALNVVREAIESLSAEQKIDDGAYLELMNHLKTVYANMPQPRPVALERDAGDAGDAGDANEVVVELSANVQLYDMYDKYFITQMTTENRYRLWGQTWEQTRHHNSLDFAKLLDAILQGNMQPTTMRDFERYSLESSFGRNFNDFLIRNKVVWRDANMREKFITLPVVRYNTLSCMLQRKQCVGRLIKWAGNETAPHWAKVLHIGGIGFMNTMKYSNQTEVSTQRSEAELKKLHLVEVRWQLGEQVVMMRLYTDKIQLGRTKCIKSLYTIALTASLLHPEFNAPIERFLYRIDNKDTQECPVMQMSGITANTRTKGRSYKQKDGDFTITYISKLNDVDV